MNQTTSCPKKGRTPEIAALSESPIARNVVAIRRIAYAFCMTTIPSAHFEISIDGIPRTYQDRADFANEAAANLKRSNPHVKVVMRDMRTDEQTVVPVPAIVFAPVPRQTR